MVLNIFWLISGWWRCLMPLKWHRTMASIIGIPVGIANFKIAAYCTMAGWSSRQVTRNSKLREANARRRFE